MIVETINGQQYVHIADLSSLSHKTIAGLRYLIEKGNVIRKMKATYHGSRLLIPVEEIYGFPFVERGRAKQKEIYHLNERGELYKCKQCSYEGLCQAAKKAIDVNIPAEVKNDTI